MNEIRKIHPCLVIYNNPEQGLVVMVNHNEFEQPGVWGIVLADAIQHITNAYAAQGMLGPEVRRNIVELLLSELEEPTDKAQRLDGEWTDEGFISSVDEEEKQ
jgi:hypothetical protein